MMEDIGSGTATLRDDIDSAYAGASGRIVGFEAGTFLIAPFAVGIAETPALAFGAGEIAEIRLSKSDGRKLSEVDGSMGTFLKALGQWAEVNGTAGRMIESLPLEGPGTMRWVAR